MLFRSLDFVGICDHNSAENVRAAKKAGEAERVSVIGGMEVTSSEEVHILALFDEDRQLRSLQEIIYKNLYGTNDKRLYGDQLVVNEKDEVIRYSRKLLIGATTIPVHQVVELIHKHNGLAIASHIDREGFSIIGQLGFIPEDLPLDAVEITGSSHVATACLAEDFPTVVSSDAHFIEDVGKRRTCFLMEDITVKELRRSFRREAGRRVIL